MPIISEKDLAKIQKTIALANSRAFNEQRTRERQIGVARFSAEAVLTAALMGYARGYIEKRGPDSKFVIPYTNADAELVLGLGGLFGALVGGKYLGRYEEDVLAASLGMMSHYAGQVGRQSALTGKFSAVAGGAPELIGRSHSGLFGPHQYPARAGADSLAELLNEVP